MTKIVKNLKLELSLFIVTVVLSFMIVVFSINFKQDSLDNRNMALQKLKQVTTKYYTAVDRKKLLEKYSSSFSDLKESGIVGNENRLHWVDVLDKTHAKHKIPYLKYTIKKQQKLSSSRLAGAFPGIDVFQTSMILHLQLLHEGDLFTVLNSLDKNAKGLFDIQSCSISRNSGTPESIKNSTTNFNFSSVCRLNWYTIKKKSAAMPTKHS